MKSILSGFTHLLKDPVIFNGYLNFSYEEIQEYASKIYHLRASNDLLNQ